MMRKVANPNTALGALREGLLGALRSPATLGLMAAPVIGMGVRKFEIRRKEREAAQGKQVAFKQMLDLHPHFKQRDPTDVGRIYNSLHNASPAMARDPMVAGAWVEQVMSAKHPEQNTYQHLLNAVRELNGIQKNITDIERNTVRTPQADKAETWVRDFGVQYDRAMHDDLGRRINEANAGFDKKIEKLDRLETKDRIRRDLEHHEELKRKGMQAFQAQDDKLVKREKELNAFEEHLQKLHDERNKKSSARTALGEMLEALKV